MEYGRLLKPDAVVQQIGISQLRSIATHAVASGATSFILNRWPRCYEAVLFPLESLKSLESANSVWALSLATNNWRLSQAAAAALSSSRQGKIDQIVPTLVHARDHVDSSAPLLHYMLASAAVAALPGADTGLLARSKEALGLIGRPDLAALIKSDSMAAMAELLLLLRDGEQGKWNRPPIRQPVTQDRPSPA